MNELERRGSVHGPGGQAHDRIYTVRYLTTSLHMGIENFLENYKLPMPNSDIAFLGAWSFSPISTIYFQT